MRLKRARNVVHGCCLSAKRWKSEETQQKKCKGHTQSLPKTRAALCGRHLLLQGGQSIARSGAGYRRAADVGVNDRRLGAAKAALAGRSNGNRRRRDKISLISRSATGRWRNDGRSLTRISVRIASLLTRRRRQNAVDQDGLIASCRGARNAPKRGEQGRETIAPSHVIGDGSSRNGANVRRGRCLVRHHSRAKKIRYSNRGNNQNDCDNH